MEVGSSVGVSDEVFKMVTEKNTQLAIMFADVVGSTQLYEKLGDTRAHEQIESCLLCISSIISKNNGEVVQTIGDEVMCRFPDADSAVKAACEIQESLNAKPDSNRQQLQVRIGLQYGPVIFEAENVFGDTVNVAARMANLSRARQIFTTEYTVNNLSLEHKNKTRKFDRLPVKGKQEKITIYQIIWEDDTESLTNIIPIIPADEVTSLSLYIRYKNLEIRMTGDSPDIVIGRNKQCNIVVDSRYVSRIHSRFEHRRGKKIVLVDLSTNGTYVRTRDGVDIHLHREELLLSGAGIISLGEPISDNNNHLIYFKCG